MTPVRAPGSLRRTSTLEATFPDGPTGPTRHRLRARDLHTDASDAPNVLGDVEVVADARMNEGVHAITATPTDGRIERLIGANPFVRWGDALDTVLADEGERGTLLYNVLDALAGWSRLASYGVRVQHPAAYADVKPPRELLPVDNCSGWRDNGTIVLLHKSGQSGAGFIRPDAPDLGRADDPLAWHTTMPLPPASMRRRRRIDLCAGADGAPIRLDAHFRDTHFESDGRETVLHEYTLMGLIDPDDYRVLALSATPHTLPYQECPWATGSVQTLVGSDIRSMRTFVRKQMRGPSSCTHLNEFLRTFADVGAMAEMMHS
jgi:hypothetical protein